MRSERGRERRGGRIGLRLLGVCFALAWAAASLGAQNASPATENGSSAATVQGTSPAALPGGVLGVLGTHLPAPAGSVPADAPVIAVSVGGASVKSGQTITVPPTQVADTSDAITVTISNTGGSPLELDQYAPPELYGDGSMMYLIDYSTYNRTIDPGESTSITVTFFPYQTGTDNAVLVIISNDPRTPQFEIDLSGKGLPMSDSSNPSAQTYGGQ